MHPKFYGHEETSAHGPFDVNRDLVILPLIKHCVKIGKPILGICRGFQEFNVEKNGQKNTTLTKSFRKLGIRRCY